MPDGTPIEGAPATPLTAAEGIRLCVEYAVLGHSALPGAVFLAPGSRSQPESFGRATPSSS
jgi:hypothetical protein